MNTWGLRSVNTDTFNIRYHTNYYYPRAARNVIVTALRVTNLALNVMGYIPGVSFFSGIARIALGVGFCAVTLAVGDRNADQGVIIQHWYDEAMATGISQIARGALEAFVPYGRAVNAGLDVLGTIYNLTKDCGNASVCEGCRGYQNHGPHSDADYPFPANLLYLV